jgi:hypothetical protein
MRKISTVAMGRIENFKDQQLTIGLDLGDRFSHYCILNEAGEVIGERNLPTTPKGIDEVFGKIPRSRIALETGTRHERTDIKRRVAYSLCVRQEAADEIRYRICAGSIFGGGLSLFT